MTVTDAAHVNLQRTARGSRRVLDSRVGRSVLTHDLELVWPDVSARLRSMLRRRGVKHHDIDEIVQETAARAISTCVPYDDADDLFRWASVVSGRLAIDLHRRGTRLSDDELPDRADTIDVAMTAEHRVVLGAVRNRLPELSERDQEVLLSSFHDGPALDRRESVRLAVARHRARSRLRHLLDGLAGSAVVLWIRRNRVWAEPAAEAISYAAVPTAVCVLITLGAWGGASDLTMRGVASPPRPVASVVSVSPLRADPAISEPIVAHRPSETSPERPGGSSGVQMPDASLTIPDPDGSHTTRVNVRDKEESDHLWCLTPPPEVGQPTRCFDSPVPLPPTP